MTKPLSELIEASDPNPHLPESQFVDVAAYGRMKSIAVMLAKAGQAVADRHNWQSEMGECICEQHKNFRLAITEARKILEGGV